MSWQFEANLDVKLCYYVTSGTQFRSTVLNMFHKTGNRSGFENAFFFKYLFAMLRSNKQLRMREQ